MMEIKNIMEDLKNLEEINSVDLDRLGKKS